MKKQLLQIGAASLGLLPGLAMAGSASFTVSAKTEPAVSVICWEDLRFGTISVGQDNGEGTITVQATSGATASGSSSDVYPAASESGPAACTVTNSTDSAVTAQLSDATTSQSGATLSDVKLMNADSALSAMIVLGKASGIEKETIYVGGTLTIPAEHVDWGSYSKTITLTITE